MAFDRLNTFLTQLREQRQAEGHETRLLDAILGAPAAPQPAAAAARPAASAARPASAGGDPQVRDLQQRLVAAGFDPGPIDGLMGPRTRAAQQAFNSAQMAQRPPVARPGTPQPAASPLMSFAPTARPGGPVPVPLPPGNPERLAAASAPIPRPRPDPAAQVAAAGPAPRARLDYRIPTAPGGPQTVPLPQIMGMPPGLPMLPEMPETVPETPAAIPAEPGPAPGWTPANERPDMYGPGMAVPRGRSVSMSDMPVPPPGFDALLGRFPGVEGGGMAGAVDQYNALPVEQRRNIEVMTLPQLQDFVRSGDPNGGELQRANARIEQLRQQAERIGQPAPGAPQPAPALPPLPPEILNAFRQAPVRGAGFDDLLRAWGMMPQRQPGVGLSPQIMDAVRRRVGVPMAGLPTLPAA